MAPQTIVETGFEEDNTPHHSKMSTISKNQTRRSLALAHLSARQYPDNTAEEGDSR
jgi:hypothetical protein